MAQPFIFEVESVVSDKDGRNFVSGFFFDPEAKTNFKKTYVTVPLSLVKKVE